MKKINQYWVALATITIAVSIYFAFVQYTILSISAVYPLIFFYICHKKKSNWLFLFLEIISFLVLIIGLARTVAGMG